MAERLLLGRVLTAAIGPWAESRGVGGLTRGHLGDFLGKGFPAKESDSGEGSAWTSRFSRVCGVRRIVVRVWRKGGEGRLVLVSLGNLGKQVILQLLARWVPRRGIIVVVGHMHERSGGAAGEEFVRGRRRR